MKSSDDSQDRELLERYGQASRADPRAPSAAVRAAILDEARRVAASLSTAAVGTAPAPRRASRWRMTAWGTAAAGLLAALVIAPRLWDQAPPSSVAAIRTSDIPFNQAAKKTESGESTAEPRPVVPVMPVTGPRLESIAPRAMAETPTLRRAMPPPPPVYVPEQSVEVTELNRTTQSARQSAQHDQSASLARATAVPPSYAAGSDATPSLPAAAAAGASAKTTQLLDQGADINSYDDAGRTPLIVAIGQNQIDTVRMLLDRGADPNAADERGLTPLALARQNKLNDVAAMLVKAGAH